MENESMAQMCSVWEQTMEIELGKLYLAGSMPSIFIDFLQLGRIT